MSLQTETGTRVRIRVFAKSSETSPRIGNAGESQETMSRSIDDGECLRSVAYPEGTGVAVGTYLTRAVRKRGT